MEETESDSAIDTTFEPWEKDSNDSDSEFGMQGQALPVAPFDVDKVDPTAVPLTSQEYLQQVIAERARLPRVVTASVPKLKPNCQRSNLCIFPDKGIVDSPLKPSVEWQDRQIFDFSNLRFKIECNKESWRGTCLENLPNTKSDWFKFLFEEKQSGKKADLLQQPYLDIVLQMSNETMENVVKNVIEWIFENKLSIYAAGMWLFALLACIEVPICITLMNRLRKFVIHCRKRRKEIDICAAENKPELAALNLFICLVGRYFGQRDLAD